eukprot:Plantae.Rhodophyta-Purpureofilum_apyrenoidigerum.ctg9216.p1 GENE.Plantae.Rhodophyta-Purpureofilum_apyrenoidigerum.ctg9216~~Plantae.Rhodophyta-Purpureofilum_apyrenoidigerum.ctg9216.p1  ORF type:complete len:583 (-),score=121.27 Plantae.Rhodophyta-Purpureofilum_apyrenoidigerum.ctg9216:277-2025(-)
MLRRIGGAGGLLLRRRAELRRYLSRMAAPQMVLELNAMLKDLAAKDITEDMSAEQKKAIRDARKAMKEQEKAEKKEKKKAAAAVAAATAADKLVEAVSYLSINDEPKQVYGEYSLIQSSCSPEGSGRTFTRVNELDESKADQQIWIRARLHHLRAAAKNAFLVLRQRSSTVQAILAQTDATPKDMVKWVLKNVTTESILDIKGTVKLAEVKSCTQTKVEISVERLYMVSKAGQPLPFLPDDAARPDSEEGVHVERNTRLNARMVDLRVMAHQAVFRVQSGVCLLFREFLTRENFVEIHTPKLIGGASEGGANVFKLTYFDQPACLAQSPQLYKQMAICGDMERVFEIGPVFRAEHSYTHRHLTEFTGLDFEMAINEHYMEIVKLIDRLFTCIFDGLNERFADELRAVNAQYPFRAFEYRAAGENLVLTYPEGVALLRESGVEMDDFEDLSTETERKLGQIIKEKYGVDFFIMTEYPSAIRPFYTMQSPKNPQYSNSFDVFMRGEEIISGAQRVHDSAVLEKRVAAQGVDVETLRDYINAFKYGAPPHGGCGVGLERVVMLFLDIGNVRETSMFPRDPTRLTP